MKIQKIKYTKNDIIKHFLHSTCRGRQSEQEYGSYKTFRKIKMTKNLLFFQIYLIFQKIISPKYFILET